MNHDLKHRPNGKLHSSAPHLSLPTAPALPEDGFDLVAVLQGWLKHCDLEVLAKHLG